MLKHQLEFLFIIIFIVTISETHGHGMMLDPVSRSSRWRYDKSAPINYDDNGLFCGGFGVQWNQNKGKCGMCGDDFAAPRPRPNELGGKYGQGVITKHYSKSQLLAIKIKITTNHLGFFYFNICNLDKFKKESEACFSANKIKFSDGSDKMYIGSKSGMIFPVISLPKGFSCKHCVLRWNYQAGNNWGPCGNGTSAKGCGPQENFKGCSDISITAKFSEPKKVLPTNWFNTIFKTNNYLDYVVFEPKDEVRMPKKLLNDKYFYKTLKIDEFNEAEGEEQERTVPDFVEEQSEEKGFEPIDIFQDLYEFDQELENNSLEDEESSFDSEWL